VGSTDHVPCARFTRLRGRAIRVTAEAWASFSQRHEPSSNPYYHVLLSMSTLLCRVLAVVPVNGRSPPQTFLDGKDLVWTFAEMVWIASSARPNSSQCYTRLQLGAFSNPVARPPFSPGTRHG
jgi:hypothetical protein